MAECTNECILLMFISHAPTLFVNKDIDYYVLSSLMKGFRNILMILSTKPKFQPIQYNTIFMQIVTWFFLFFSLIIYRLQQEGIPRLVIGTKNDRV